MRTMQPICFSLLLLTAAPVHFADAATTYAIAVPKPACVQRNSEGQQVVREQIVDTTTGNIHSTCTVYNKDGTVFIKYESGPLATDEVSGFSNTTGFLAGTRTFYTLTS